MKQQGVTHMEVTLIAVSVFAAGILLINKLVLEPEKKAEVTQEDRLKIQINSLENKLKAYADVGQRIADIETDLKKAWDTLDHVQNIAENGDNFMKANQQEIENIKEQLNKFSHEVKKQVPEIVQVKLEEFKKPIVAQLQQTRAHRPVTVTWKKGRKGWHMVDKTVEYSRAEYMKKLRKQKTK